MLSLFFHNNNNNEHKRLWGLEVTSTKQSKEQTISCHLNFTSLEEEAHTTL